LYLNNNIKLFKNKKCKKWKK